MRLDLTTLRLFLAVVEERSMARAAEREHITPPAVSKRIGELESDLGVMLFERQRTGIRTTPAGDTLAAEVRQVFHALERMQGKLSEYANGRRGQVSILSSPSGLVGPLPEHLKAFMLAHPLVSLRLDERHSDEVVRGVAEGQADIGIFAHHIIPQVHAVAEGLTVVPYQTLRLMLLTPKDHPLSGRREVAFVEAAEYPFVGLTEASAVGVLIHRITAEQGLMLKSRIQVTGFEPLRRMVQAGLGVGILPEYCAYPYSEAMGLSCVPLADNWAQYQDDICTRSPETLAFSARLTLEYLMRAASPPSGLSDIASIIVG